MRISSSLFAFAIALLVSYSADALAASPCCARNPANQKQCKQAPDIATFTVSQSSTGCWEDAYGNCTGGSPLHNCVCIAGSCFARHWAERMQHRNPVYYPVTPEQCTSVAQEGCCNPGRYLPGTSGNGDC